MPKASYKSRPLSISIGRAKVVELPPRVVRGRLTCDLFEPDKSFLLPSALEGMRGLVSFDAEYTGLSRLLTLHRPADKDADEDKRRATARADIVRAFLLGQPDAWLSAYGEGGWGIREDQHMLAMVEDADGPCWRGPPNGADDVVTKDAVKRFQRLAGLGESGRADTPTRRELIARYLGTPGSTLPAGAALEVHACAAFDAEPIGVDDERCELFLFEKGIDPSPGDDCPAGGCEAFKTWVTRSVRTVDLHGHAPAILGAFLAIELVDAAGQPMANVRYRVTATDGTVKDGRLGDDGRARVEGILPGLCRVTFPELDSGAWDLAK